MKEWRKSSRGGGRRSEGRSRGSEGEKGEGKEVSEEEKGEVDSGCLRKRTTTPMMPHSWHICFSEIGSSRTTDLKKMAAVSPPPPKHQHDIVSTHCDITTTSDLLSHFLFSVLLRVFGGQNLSEGEKVSV